MQPYAIVSDIHAHGWKRFSKTLANGVNSRLQTILDELIRAAETVKASGGDRLRVAGDLFHIRGKIEPSVFNPTYDTFRHITVVLGIKVDIIPGNHDLEGAHADRLGNAMQQLDQLPGVTVIMEANASSDNVIMIPWIEDLDELRAECIKQSHPDHDLIIHAPLNGVIKGLPDLGLDPVEIAAWGYKRVFVGHYHNHCEPTPGIFSVGATTHQTWSDVNTTAGFLIIHEDRVEHHPSHAPSFVNIDDPSEITRANVKGNYVRLRLKDADHADLEMIKKELDAQGALDWVDHSSKKRTVVRGVTSSCNNVSLEVSVTNYVDDHLEVGTLDKARIQKDALSVLAEARTVGDD